MFYYPLSFFSVLGDIPSLIFGLLFTAIIITAIQQKIFGGNTTFPWKKVLLLNCLSLVTFIGTLYLLGVSGALEGIGSLIMMILESLFGYQWDTFNLLLSLILVLLVIILINFIIFGTLFWLWLYQKTSQTHQMPSFITAKSVLTGITSFIATPIIAFILMFITMGIMSKCNSIISDTVIRVNAHVKSLCNEDLQKGECPKNHQELAAFDPRSFQRLSWCAVSKYHYDPSSQTGTWIVYHPDQKVYVSHPQFYPGFGYFPIQDLYIKLPQLEGKL